VTPDLLRRALARPSPFPTFEWKHEPPPRPAAVIVPVAFEPEPTVYAVLRASNLRDHAGEVGYPGGKPEVSDVDLRATALRELEEEVALDDVEILGELHPVPVLTGRFVIHPFVAAIGEARPAIRATEIAEILPIALQPYLTGTTAIEAVKTSWGGLDFLTPHFHLLTQSAGRVVLYGASAFVLWELLLRISAELGAELPAPVVVETRPWGDRYGSPG